MARLGFKRTHFKRLIIAIPLAIVTTFLVVAVLCNQSGITVDVVPSENRDRIRYHLIDEETHVRMFPLKRGLGIDQWMTSVRYHITPMRSRDYVTVNVNDFDNVPDMGTIDIPLTPGRFYVSLPVNHDGYIADEAWIGLPFRCCWTGISHPRTPSEPTAERWLGSGRLLDPSKGFWKHGLGRDYGLPTGILALGFVANASIYFITWFGVLSIASFVRHRNARRKHLCPNCRYDLRGLAVDATCPECGSTKSARSAADTARQSS